MRSAIIDSSCLINLVHLDLASKLILFFDRVYVPRNVQAEFNRKHRSRYRLNKLFRSGVFEKCMCKDETNFRILRFEVDAGEAEALVQAQEKGAEFVLVDERRAREIGVRQGLTPYGTVRLLARLSRDGTPMTHGCWSAGSGKSCGFVWEMMSLKVRSRAAMSRSDLEAWSRVAILRSPITYWK